MRSTAARYGLLLCLLVLASDFQFRARDASLALAGDVDWHVLGEVAIWGIVGLWAAWRTLTDARLFVTRLPGTLGPALKAVCVLALLSVLSALYAGSALSLARALQFSVLTAVVLLIHHDVTREAVNLADLWIWLRRGVWVLVLVATAVTAAFPQLTETAVTWPGVVRYRWFYVHPITTGVLVGVAIVWGASAFLSLRDPLLTRRGWPTAGRWVLLAAFCLLLFLTKSRGPMIATAVAVLLLTVVTRSPRARGLAVLGGCVGLGLLLLGVGAQFVGESVIRQQTASELFSLTGRDSLFAHGFTLFEQRPIVGHGYLAARSIFLEQFPWAGGAHNAVLEIAISMGVLGLAAFFVVFLQSFRGLWTAARSGSDPVALCAREAFVLMIFLLTVGVTRESFGGAVGLEVMIMLLAALIADHARRTSGHTAGAPGRHHISRWRRRTGRPTRPDARKS